MVHNRTIDLFRREVPRVARPLDEGDIAERLVAPDSTELEVERRAEADRVRLALHELPDDQRHVIELAYYGGFTHQQIAEMLSLPPGTVKGRMRLGLSKLRISCSEAGVLP
jgi:RNA polymerase sigma-70 factor (ECF subfamily)